MPIHKVTMKQPREQILNKDVIFVVREGENKLGELHVSKGSIEWKPSNGRFKRRMRWSKFAQFMDDEGRAVRKS
jgi:hypothetical protein